MPSIKQEKFSSEEAQQRKHVETGEPSSQESLEKNEKGFSSQEKTKNENVGVAGLSQQVSSMSASAVIEEADKELKMIEEILSDGLNNVYEALSPDQKRVFKQKGEETAGTIHRILHEVGFQAKKIISLIMDWLKLIPGVNKIFIKQEAKLRADRLAQLSTERKVDS